MAMDGMWAMDGNQNVGMMGNGWQPECVMDGQCE